MNKLDVIKAIEAHHWDYEEEWIPSYIETIEEEGVKATKNPKMHNVLSNKVVELSIEGSHLMQEQWDKIKKFYGDVPFSLWLEASDSERFTPILEKDGYSVTDRYDGVAYFLDQYSGEPLINKNINYIEVKSDEDIRSLVEVSSLIWNYPEEQQESIFNQRKSYIDSPYRNGGYILALKDSLPVAYSNYRYSSDGNIMFMNGSGVLAEFRHQGIYSDMVSFRLGHARLKGALLATCQARQGHSAPVLRKLGFQKYSTYDYWVYTG
ncbi:GNAT family N-acetyltransferase [Bacillus salacetis]|uniref:GNAT family N-acetyltransferase n=1 Tax=Bacillus salacetis TaxID=2315464 RepID=UPI003BA04180